MARLRYNGLSATLGGSGLTNSATSVTFAAALTHSGGTAVPTISSPDYIPLEILDSTGKLSEVVWLTAYTSAATTGTIARGKEGTTGVSHASGDKVTHSATVLDVEFRGCAIENTGAQTITTAVWTAVQFGSEVHDADGMHDTVTNNTRLTIPAGLGGKWRFTATTQLAGGGSGVRAVAWKKNGTQLADRFGAYYGLASPAYATVRTVSLELVLAPTDYVEHVIYHENGADMNVNSAYLTAHFLG